MREIVGLLVFVSMASALVPGIDDLLKLNRIGGSAISPDGKYVAYGVTTVDFEQDAWVTQLWIAVSASRLSRPGLDVVDGGFFDRGPGRPG
jgi:hypothetical protein